MSYRMLHRGLAILLLLAAAAVPAAAQEDVEPRIVGKRGTTTIGLAGFIDRFGSSEDTFPTRATMLVDATRFVTGRIAVRAGLIGAAAFGEDDDDEITGPGAATLDAHGGALFYFTPQSMVSFYAGLEYRSPLTRRADKEAGTALGLGGFQATVSSRVSVFMHGGYGMRLTRGDEGELQTRLTGELGFRIRF